MRFSGNYKSSLDQISFLIYAVFKELVPKNLFFPQRFKNDNNPIYFSRSCKMELVSLNFFGTFQAMCCLVNGPAYIPCLKETTQKINPKITTSISETCQKMLHFFTHYYSHNVYSVKN
jgi:hypothetical protein